MELREESCISALKSNILFHDNCTTMEGVVDAPSSLHILAISGSLKVSSCNTGILRAAASRLPDGVTLEIYIPGDLPLFNQDTPDDVERENVAVKAFREKVLAADAILFSVCEHNFSISAALKNALDWASRGPRRNCWSEKACAVVGSGGGMGSLRAQQHFRDIALELNLHVMNSPGLQIQIWSEPKPFDLRTGDLVDEKLLARTASVVEALCAWSRRLKR